MVDRRRHIFSTAVGLLVVGLALIGASRSGIAPADEPIELAVDASKAGAKIDRNIFPASSPNISATAYKGIWVGPKSPIPNTRGIRNDAVGRAQGAQGSQRPLARLLCRRIPLAQRHRAVGTRAVTLNPNWGGVTEPNTFGTQFMDFLDQIGAEAFISVNVGSGTPQEAAEWLEYLTTAQPTTLAKERAANGHPAPYKVAYLGIGNESWDCGGNMTPDHYLSQLKIYSRFVRNFNPAQQEDGQRMQKIAVGPGGGGEPRWTEWTDVIMKAWQVTSGAGTSTASPCTTTPWCAGRRNALQSGSEWPNTATSSKPRWTWRISSRRALGHHGQI